jgi:FAD/FMN-containing dehydrogenase
VLSAVAELGGSISAEHGIGRTKARWLGLARSPDAISWMRDLKATVDPQGLLNPGVLFGP